MPVKPNRTQIVRELYRRIAEQRGAETLSDEDRQRAIRRATLLADLMDRAFQIPGTRIRFGLDSIVGLVPVVGDTASALLGLYPVMEAARFGARKRAMARMLANLGFDWLVGLLPGLDLILDVACKANVRNARILARELERNSAFTGTSRSGSGTRIPVNDAAVVENRATPTAQNANQNAVISCERQLDPARMLPGPVRRSSVHGSASMQS